MIISVIKTLETSECAMAGHLLALLLHVNSINFYVACITTHC